MLYSRRDIGRIALASMPLAKAFGAQMIDSTIGGVQIGAITYSFNSIARESAEPIIKAMQDIGLGEVELMSNHCEQLAGAPQAQMVPMGGAGGGRRQGPGGGAGQGPGGGPGQGSGGGPGQAPGGGAGQGPGGGAGQGRGPGGGFQRPQLTPEQQAAREEAQAKLTAWRAAATPATWQAVRRKFSDAGIEVALLCYNMNDRMTDDDIEYGFKMAEGLGVKGMTTSTTMAMAKRIAPIADKHKLLVGYHGHDATNDPNQTATLESYETLMAYGGYNGINLDIGHFTAAGYDAVEFIRKYHARITNLHLKDRKKEHGPNVFPWGTGDTPMRDVLQLLKKEKYPWPANLELEGFPRDQDVVELGKQCYAVVKKCLA